MHPTVALPDAIQRSLDAQLEADESVLWVGRPDRRQYAKAKGVSSLWFMVLLTVLWTAIVLISPYSSFDNYDVHWAMYLIPALCIASLLSQLVQRSKARSLYYAVTDKRALIFEARRKVRITSFYPRDIVGFACVPREAGYGDVVLRAEPYRDAEGDVRMWTFGFFGIRDPQHVAALVRPLALSPEEKRDPEPTPACNFPVSVAAWKRSLGLRQK